MAERYCKICTGWHDLDKPWPDNCRAEANWLRADFAMPGIISDSMPPTMSMVDGRIYDSKHAIRATYKPSGNRDGKEYIEVGNDPSRLLPHRKIMPDRKKIRDAVRRAMVEYSYGRRPDPRPDTTRTKS